jgi:multidrug efflux pump subunit AcrA (membrane-fusion protein)
MKKGMPAGITGDSFKGTYNGVVLEISQQIKSEITLQGEGERYAEVVIELYDADRKLMPGSSVLAKIYTSKKKDVITLPYEAVTQDSSNKEVVYTVHNGKIQKKYVVTGYELSNLVEIKSGISRSDEVVLSPTEELEDGKKVVVNN